MCVCAYVRIYVYVGSPPHMAFTFSDAHLRPYPETTNSIAAPSLRVCNNK